MDSNYRKTRKTHSRGSRASQPLATDVLEGTLYFVTDESVIERSNGSAWESFSGTGSGSISNAPSPILIPIIDGEDGIDGFPGLRGSDGIAGAAGVAGTQGLRGIPGMDGLDGEPTEPLIFALQAASTGIPGGSNTQVQFNDSSVFGGDAGLTYNKTTDSLILAGLLDISGAAAGQIKFPATQNPSANANTLDDYERGTWTPTDASGASLILVNPDTGSGSPFGTYIKIGQIVLQAFGVQYPVTADSSIAAIGGFPFTTETGAGTSNWGGGMSYTNSNGVTMSVSRNVTNSKLYSFAPSPVAQTNVQMSTKSVYGNIQYRATQ